MRKINGPAVKAPRLYAAFGMVTTRLRKMHTTRKLDLWQRLGRLVGELGLGMAFLYGCDRLLRRINSHCGLYCYCFFAQPLSLEPRLPPTRGQSFSFRLLTGMEPVLDGLGRPEIVLRDRFSQGSQCLLATKNETFVGCIWFARGDYAEDEVRVDYLLPPSGDCVWDFDVYVAEAQRLGYLFARQWDAFDALLQPQGVRYTVSRINAFNQRSMASHESMGAHRCGRALFICLGPLQVMVSDRRPYVALGGRPKLHIGPNEVVKS